MLSYVDIPTDFVALPWDLACGEIRDKDWNSALHKFQFCSWQPMNLWALLGGPLNQRALKHSISLLVRPVAHHRPGSDHAS